MQAGHAELNPSYKQPTNTKPVWSLAKPLPHVVQPGIVPTKEELQQSHANAQLPLKNAQKLGLEVDPNKVNKGRIDTTTNLWKMTAQEEDARCETAQSY